MKLLFLSHWYPVPPDNGGKLRVYHLANGLARKHEVTLVSVTPYVDGPLAERDELLDRCAQNIVFRKPVTSGWSTVQLATNWGPLPKRLWTLFSSIKPTRVRDANDPEFVALLSRLKQEQNYDAVWVSMDFMGENARRAGFERIVLDVVDLDSLSYLSVLRARGWYKSKALHYGEFAKIWLYERRLPHRYWRLVVCRQDDVGFFEGSEDRVHVVPNGVATFEPTPPDREQPGELMFVGTLHYEPNIDAILLPLHLAADSAAASGRTARRRRPQARAGGCCTSQWAYCRSRWDRTGRYAVLRVGLCRGGADPLRGRNAAQDSGRLGPWQSGCIHTDRY
jgi:hypothetical protein